MKVDKQLESGDSGVIGEKYVKEVLQDTNERNCSLIECEKEKQDALDLEFSKLALHLTIPDKLNRCLRAGSLHCTQISAKIITAVE